tara:strand:- start:228 stop:725 length:498 start_codon:yes stop_codon:yes gene_type:complete
MNKLGRLFLTMMNIGLLRPFPGTIASATTSFYYIGCFHYNVSFKFLLIIFLLFSFLAVYLINLLSDQFDEIDSKEIVIDEFLGQSVPLLFFYFLVNQVSSNTYLFFILTIISFIGFRFFDIIKPYPINYVDKNMKNGLGVVLDDLIAGLYTTIILYISIIIYDKL